MLSWNYRDGRRSCNNIADQKVMQTIYIYIYINYGSIKNFYNSEFHAFEKAIIR